MPSFVEPPAAAGEPPVLTPDQKEWQALVKRIAASEVLSRASQLREILLYVVHRSLHDTYPIKERDIACEVLKRPPNFDGTLDNIVRVQVGHLRRKLDQYFATEGKDEPLLIVIPRGSYVPRFEVRERPVEKVAEKPHDSAELELPLAPETVVAPSRRGWIVAAVCLLMAVVGLAIYALRPRPAAIRASAQAPLVKPTNPITTRIFDSANAVSVVAADANTLLIEAILHHDVSISEYLAPDYPMNLLTPGTPAETRDLIRMIAVRRYTSFSDTSVVLLTSKVANQFGKEILPRYSRFLNTRDLGQGNFILIGRSPWMSLFTPKLNFVQEDSHSSSVTHAIRNRNPQPGELALYPVIGDWSTESTSYASIGLLPNLSQTGYILVLAGTGSEATEAAMDFLASPESTGKLKRFLGGHELDEHEPFEILLRVHSVQGTAHDFEIAAVRSKTK